jgi:hypothetical protein
VLECTEENEFQVDETVPMMQVSAPIYESDEPFSVIAQSLRRLEVESVEIDIVKVKSPLGTVMAGESFSLFTA